MDTRVEAVAVRDLLSKLTGCPFRVCDQDPIEPISDPNPVWFVSCPEVGYMVFVAHVLLAWRGREGSITVQTIPLTYTAMLVQREYGLLAGDLAAAIGANDFGDPRARRKHAEEFPRAEELLKVYEGVAERTGREKGVDLRLVYGGKGRSMKFSYGAVVKAREDICQELTEIEKAVDALKVAYREIVTIMTPGREEWLNPADDPRLR